MANDVRHSGQSFPTLETKGWTAVQKTISNTDELRTSNCLYDKMNPMCDERKIYSNHLLWLRTKDIEVI